MPIYEFYCSRCHAIYSFLSKSINTTTAPNCPQCGKRKLRREVSGFAVTGKAGKDDAADDLPIDESKMEDAMASLASEAEGMNEEDPRQAAKLMRKFSQMTGMEMGGGMEEALGRLEAGEDPDVVEKEMGDLMEGEDPFILPGKKGSPAGARKKKRGAPTRDPSLYEM